MSADKVTALAEYKQDNPWLQPGTICTLLRLYFAFVTSLSGRFVRMVFAIM
ncbi:hypothetical protein [Sodalis sp. RH16]|uniref:hypothetical protein n=1 Tax=unclassified Sodalis (in: enterobacteria) TaxID=2636512 RepID=UPI0039B69A9A